MILHRMFLAAALGFAALAPLPASAQARVDAPWQLDAVLDVRHARQEGVEVLAVTPGGAAASLGLLPGDRVLSINGQTLAGSGQPSVALRRALEMSGGQARLAVLRQGESLTLDGALSATADIREVAGCGFVSTTDPTPTVSERIHPAEITMIDGRSTPLFGVNRHRVDAGERVLVVSEHIPSHLFSRNQQHQMRLMKQREHVRAYKAIVVKVEPGMRYSIGARLLLEGNDAEQVRDNTYWEPVVYQSRAEDCR